jgi:hypothetical protein
MFKNYRRYELSQGVKSARLAVFSDAWRIQVLLHKTVVVDAVFNRRTKAWEVTLDHGGWDTISSRLVINQALCQMPGLR